MTQSLPEGFHTLQPHLVVTDADAAIAFYQKVFGAVEVCRMKMPGTDIVMHAELQIGDSKLMLATEFDNGQCGSKSPLKLGGTPVTMHLYVDNVDTTFKQALEAGAQAIMPPGDMFWGDRYGKLRDPFGHEWSIAAQVRVMTPQEVEAAAEEFFRQPQPVS